MLSLILRDNKIDLHLIGIVMSASTFSLVHAMLVDARILVGCLLHAVRGHGAGLALPAAAQSAASAGAAAAVDVGTIGFSGFGPLASLSIPSIVLSGLLYGLGYSVIHQTATEWVSRRYAPFERARPVALVATFFQIGSIVAPIWPVSRSAASVCRRSWG